MPAKRRFTPDDLYNLKIVSDSQISPDGSQVAYVMSWPDRDADENRFAIFIAATDGKTPTRQFTQGKKDHSPRWSPDGKSLAFVSDRGDKNQVFVAPMNGGEARQVTHTKWGVGQPAWSPDGKEIAYSARVGDHVESKDKRGSERNVPRVVRDLRYKLDGVGFFDERRMHIFVVDVVSGEETQLTRGDYYDDQPAWSPNGKTIAFTSDRERERNQRQWRTDVWTVPASGGAAKKLTRSLGSAAHPTYSPDGKWIAYVGHEHGDEGVAKNTQMMVIPSRGGVPAAISERIDRPVAGWPAFASGRSFVWAADSRALLFLAQDRGTQSIYRTTLNGRSTKVLDGERQIEGFTTAGCRVAFTAVWPSVPWELYATTFGNGRRETNLSHANDKFAREVELASVKRLKYKGHNGLDVEAFVMYPADYSAGKRYPLAINVHGGPHSYHPGSRSMSEFHAFASKGYVVMLPNPRGSTGYGEKFTEACVQDWGGADYEDILAGIDQLIEDGVVDSESVYIGGYSYGGFMASWAVGHTNRFAATWVGAPVSNQISMFGTGDIPLFDIHETGGIPQENLQTYIERSPVTYLAKVNTPVLLLHHEGDLRCPIAQSEEIFHALKALGKEVEFVRYPGGFHTYVTHAPSQIKDRIVRQIAWYEDHKPKARKKKTTSRPKRVKVPASD
ncbi:MAG: S9 family peptidase [Chloroflexota bacterium]